MIRSQSFLSRCLLLFILAFVIACSAPDKQNGPAMHLPEGADTTSEYWRGIDLAPKPPVLPLPVGEQQKKFLLPPGYTLEPVLTEPQIQQPAAITFDGNGRMYVLELRTYMLNADSEGTLNPVSGISRWEDTDNDGVYETGTMFVDSLVFPRFVLPVGPNSILTMESNADNVYKYTDTNNDGQADKKEFFTDNFGRSGNVEHQQAFLYWGMDNWLYSTINPFRVRETPGGVVRESTGSNYAPVLVADMQGGMGAVRMPEGTLNRVTGSAGNDIFRGHRLPDDLRGEYFYGEPVARIVRQVHADVNEGLSILSNVFQEQKSEFIRSTDPLFRPVDMTTAPDGTLYITDMYHGIIQEGEWTPVGSYLRVKIEQYQLDKVIGLGRIWRLRHKGFERDDTQPQMYEQSTEALLKHLEHPNGWWRDMAQQVLVQRRDVAVAPALEKMARANNNLVARFHALWVLEGIGKLESVLVKDLMKDPEPRMRKQALWVSESLYKAGDKTFEKDYLALMNDTDTEVKMRAMMTGRLFKIPGTAAAVKKIMASDNTKGVQLVGEQVLNPIEVTAFFGRRDPNFTEEEKALVTKGAEIYHSLCATCHGPLGTGLPFGKDQLLAPSLVGSARVQANSEYITKVLLRGLTGDIEGKHYAGIVMAPMEQNSDEWIASIASFVRANFENESLPVKPEEVARLRKATAKQNKPYAFDELWPTIPKILTPTPAWKVTASHTGSVRKGSTASPNGAFTLEGWTTGVTQKEGMWFQIEFPTEVTVTEMQFTSQPIPTGFGKDAPPPLQTFPKGYQVEVSSDAKTWSKVVTNGQGVHHRSVIRFEPTKAKFLRVTLTKSEEIFHGQRRGKPYDYEVVWTMRELKIYGFD